MSIEKVRAHFKTLGIEDKILEFDTSSATVELAAAALGCEPKHIAKTMGFLVADSAILICTAGDAKVDNHKFKEKFHTKLKMIPFDVIENYVGHRAGGVCPFAINDGVDVYLDISLKRFEFVYPAAGSDNSAVRLTLDELEKYSNAVEWIDVCKNWE